MLTAIAGAQHQALFADQHLAAIAAAVQAIEMGAVAGHFPGRPVFAGVAGFQVLAIAAVGDHVPAIAAPHA